MSVANCAYTEASVYIRLTSPKLIANKEETEGLTKEQKDSMDECEECKGEKI